MSVRAPVLSLWVPFTFLALLAAPVAVCLSPLVLLAPPRWRINPVRALPALGRTLLAVGGLRIVIERDDLRLALRFF